MPLSVTSGWEFDDLFVVVESLVLEETADVVTVKPRVSIDPLGGFLVADSREHQVRVYSNTGALERVIGDAAERADSIQRPWGADRLLNGDLVVVSFAPERIAIVPRRRDQPVQRIEIPEIRGLIGVSAVSEHSVILLGRDFNDEAFLHLWDLRRSEIVRSFFAPPAHLHKSLVQSLGRMHTSLRGDRLAAVYSLSDTLVVFDRTGNELSRAPIPIDEFDSPAGQYPEHYSMQEQSAWMGQSTWIEGVFWTDDDKLIVPWSTGRSGEPVHHIVQMDTTGRRIWHMAPAPKLYAVDRGNFFFQDPSSKDLNRWIVAQLRTEIQACLKSNNHTNSQGDDRCRDD